MSRIFTIMGTLFGIVAVSAACTLVIAAGIKASDYTMINGWCIVETYDDQAVIELDENLEWGTDAGCRKVATIISSLGRSGINGVKVLNWHDERILTPKWANNALEIDTAY